MNHQIKSHPLITCFHRLYSELNATEGLFNAAETDFLFSQHHNDIRLYDGGEFRAQIPNEGGRNTMRLFLEWPSNGSSPTVTGFRAEYLPPMAEDSLPVTTIRTKFVGTTGNIIGTRAVRVYETKNIDDDIQSFDVQKQIEMIDGSDLILVTLPDKEHIAWYTFVIEGEEVVCVLTRTNHGARQVPHGHHLKLLQQETGGLNGEYGLEKLSPLSFPTKAGESITVALGKMPHELFNFLTEYLSWINRENPLNLYGLIVDSPGHTMISGEEVVGIRNENTGEAVILTQGDLSGLELIY